MSSKFYRVWFLHDTEVCEYHKEQSKVRNYVSCLSPTYFPGPWFVETLHARKLARTRVSASVCAYTRHARTRIYRYGEEGREESAARLARFSFRHRFRRWPISSDDSFRHRPSQHTLTYFRRTIVSRNFTADFNEGGGARIAIT